MTNPTDQTPERKLLGEARGALNFILAFYEPGQTHLDTNAWKQAEASGRRAHKDICEFLDAPTDQTPSCSEPDGDTRHISYCAGLALQINSGVRYKLDGAEAGIMAKGFAALQRETEAAETRAAELEAEVGKLRERLEVTHVYQVVDGEMTRVPVPEGQWVPDGIECRDETIKLQGERITELQARVDVLEGALERVEFEAVLRESDRAVHPFIRDTATVFGKIARQSLSTRTTEGEK